MAASVVAAAVAAGSSFLAPFRSVAQQYALANQTLIARWMKAVIIIERKEIAPIMTVTAAPVRPPACIAFVRALWANVRCFYAIDRIL